MNIIGIVIIILIVAFIALSLVYVIGKVNELESLTERLLTIKESDSDEYLREGTSNLFAGLQGKDLWHAVTNFAEQDNLSEQDLLKFQPVLEKHINHIINKGYQDGINQSAESKPSNEMTISMLRGDVISWIPASEASKLYSFAYKAATISPERAESLANQISQAISTLFDIMDLNSVDFVDEILIKLKLFNHKPHAE
jgi:type II secretory pathway pseudopilin PulG